MKTNCPLLLKQCKEIFQSSTIEKHENNSSLKFDPIAFAKVENKSIDYQLLNRLKDTRCVKAKFGWSDVGSWDTYCDLFSKDKDGNSNASFGFSEDSSNCSAFTSRKPITMLGLKDVVVVNTDQAILVANKKHSQTVRHLGMKTSNLLPSIQVRKVGNQGAKKLTSEERRPWGRFEVLMARDGYKVKRLIVDPFQSLSLQSHQFRREHWLVVEGYAVATVNGTQHILTENDYLDIAVEDKHRISNPSHKRLVIIETQTGSYLEEDDETRYEDMYGRADDGV